MRGVSQDWTPVEFRTLNTFQLQHNDSNVQERMIDLYTYGLGIHVHSEEISEMFWRR
jgi:hypothetical protein